MDGSAGSPPPEASEGLASLYAPVPEPHIDTGGDLETLEEHISWRPDAARASAVVPATPVPPVVIAPSLSAKDQRVIDKLNTSSSVLTIRVNDVELTLDVVDVVRNEFSICCLVRLGGMRCKIPRSENVEIELEGHTYHTAFLGAWHTIEWLSVHVVVFPLLLDSPA